MEWATTLILLIFIISCYLLISSRKKQLHKGRLPPGPTPLPLIGNFLQIKPAETLKSLLNLREKYGPVFTIYFGTRPVLVLCGHKAVKEALIDKAEEFSGRTTMPSMVPTFQGYGVAFSNGKRWKELRRFSLTVLRSFGMGKKSIEERIQEEAQFLVEEFCKTKKNPFDPTFFFSRAFSNIICSIAFGNRFDYEDKEFQALMVMVHKFFREMSTSWAQVLLLQNSPEFFLFFSQFYDIYSNYLDYIPGIYSKIYDAMDMKLFIAKKIKKNQETFDSNFPRDYIDCFLIQMEKQKDNPGSEFIMKNLELSILNLILGGTETGGSTLRYGFLLLMKYPEVQEKVHEEIDRVIGRNSIPNTGDRRQMPYTDAVIHEVQRYSDVIPMNVAHMVTCDTEFRGYHIPQGMMVFPLLSTVLHDPTMFKYPDAFNPENFLDEYGCFKTNDAFVPFSSGKRICLGESLARMELFLFFTTILQNFQLKSLVPPENIDLTFQESGVANIPPFYQLSVIPR